MQVHSVCVGGYISVFTRMRMCAHAYVSMNSMHVGALSATVC